MTKIEWATETWNPVVGCTKCSPGCKNCYAERFAARLANMGRPGYCDGIVELDEKRDVYLPKWTGEIVTLPHVLDKPLHWKTPRVIFPVSMGDLFHPKVLFEFIDKVFAVMAETHHRYLVLTKRPKRMADFIYQAFGKKGFPYINTWLGATVCNQVEADEIIPILSPIPVAHRFISIEPMLEPININVNIIRDIKRQSKTYYGGGWINPYDWVVLGCESGPKRRPCKIEWMIDVVEQCKAASIPVFVKQVNINGRVSHNPEEWPAKLRVREKI